MDMNGKTTSQIRRITWIGLLVNLLLSLLKFTVGLLGSSQAVVADAVHSLSDLGTDLAVLLGVKFWSAPPDESHPYGHGRIETLLTAAIGTVLAVVAFGIGYKALVTMQEMHLKQPSAIAIVGSIVSVVLKEALYRWTVRVGKQTKSSAVIANAWHHRSDAFSSVPALAAVSLAVVSPRLAFIDHVGALAVSIIILKVSWSIMSPSLSQLADRATSRADRETIRRIALGIEGVQAVHAIRTRNLGSGLYVDLHVLVDGDMTVRKGHEISSAVRSALEAGGPDVLDVVVHLEPHD